MESSIITLTEENIRRAITDYTRHTYLTEGIEDVSDAFIERLARDSVAAKSDLRTLFQTSPSWNDELQAIVINGMRNRKPNSLVVSDLADKILMPAKYGCDYDKLRKINSILGDGFGITLISEKCYHELVMSGDDSLWECYDKHLFEPLQGTRYYYRKNAEDRIEVINDILSNRINESSLSETDCNLLETFYQKNKKLILSIYRILMENEADKGLKINYL